MNCPRCDSSVLEERERDGLLVDVCAKCRGVWLDRGELEKLIAHATRELDERGPRRDDTPPRGERAPDSDDAQGRHPRKKRGFLDSLGDIFG